MKTIVFLIIFQFHFFSVAQKQTEKSNENQRTFLSLEKRLNDVENQLKNEFKTPPKQYLEILEKTNNQLSMWTNPYGIMVGSLSALLAFLAVGVAFALYKQSSDHKQQVKEEQNDRELQFKNFLASSSSALEGINKHIAESKEEYNKLITEQKVKLSKASPSETEEIKKQLDELMKDRAKVTSDMSQTVMASWPTMGSMGFLIGPQIHKCTVCEFGFRVKNLNKGFKISINDRAEVTCPKCGNIDLI